MSDHAHIPAAGRIPPPVAFAAAFLAGFLAQRALHLGLIPSPGGILRPVGIGVTIAGILLAFWSAGLFATHRTSIIPHGNSSALIHRGPYRFSRNPMYVSMAVVYIGVTLWTLTWVPLLLLPAPLWLLNRVTIPMEERQLGSRFGESYADYCRRVRRWL